MTTRPSIYLVTYSFFVSDSIMVEILKKISTLKANMFQIKDDMQFLIDKVTFNHANDGPNAENIFQMFDFPIKDDEELSRVNN